MGVLENLEPGRVFYYFEELCKIPHGSHNTKQISDYLVGFAKEHGLKCRQDDSNNVIIWKPASEGYENAPVVILQGHCDMVCEKTPESSHDFEKDGLELMIEGDYITAKDTTLGGDDGIAVAYGLAILEDNTLKHPALELVITTDEEVGLLGAAALDTSDLKGKYLLNMDSEEEGKLWISCAGGLTGKGCLPVERTSISGVKYELVIDGLLGGHSGAEIDKLRANANKLMGDFLLRLEGQIKFGLAELAGGQKDNAITRSTQAVIVADEKDADAISALGEQFTRDCRAEYSGTDEGIQVKVTSGTQVTEDVLTKESLKKVIFYLVNMPYGIQKMSGEIPGLVQTSINPGVLMLTENQCQISASIRSSVGSAKASLREKVRLLTETLGGTFQAEGDYPAWEYRKDSKLREIMKETYEELFDSTPEIKAIHAGLECGLFHEKIDDLDCVSFGPDMKDIHTTEEVLSISSTARMWNYLLKVLENIH